MSYRHDTMEVDCFVKKAELIVGMLMLFVSSLTYGAALGQPQRTSMLGYGVGATLVSVDDPAGSTETSWALQPITLIYTARLWSNGIRYWSELYYYKAMLDAGPTRIGQDAERYGMRFSFQKKLRIIPGLSSWFGAGIDISQAKYTTRHTVDSDSFLITAYPDRKETIFAGVINVVSEWSLTRDWMIAAKLEQTIPFDGRIQESLAAVAFLYRYRGNWTQHIADKMLQRMGT